MTYNTGDRKSIRRAEKNAKVLDSARGDFVRQMMSTIPGRTYAHDQLVRCHIFSTSFSPDPVVMAFNEGERNQGLQLLNDIMMHCPEQYIQMQREANERSSHTDHTDATRRTDSGTGGQYTRGEDGDGGTETGGEYDPFDRVREETGSEA